MSNPNFHVFLIHGARQSARESTMEETVKAITMVAKNSGYNPIVHQVSQPKHPQIMMEEMRPRIDPVPTGYEDLDKETREITLTPDAISNWVCHEVSHDFIANKGPELDALHLVLEDDAVIAASPAQLQALFKELNSRTDWGMVFLGKNHVEPSPGSDSPIQPMSTKEPLICKEAYFVSPKFIPKLKDLSKKINTSVRIWFSCVHRQNTNLVYGVTKQITMDGSKFGMFPSSLHPNTHPILYYPYKELSTLVYSDPISFQDVKNRYVQIKKSTKSLHPSLMYLFGIALEKAGKLEEAIEVWEEAMEQKDRLGGAFGPSCPITQKLMPHYIQQNQSQIKDMLRLPSKIQAYEVAK